MIIKGLTEGQANDDYNVKIIKYKTGKIEIKHYEKTIKRTKKGLELREEKTPRTSSKNNENKEIDVSNLRRTRNLLMMYAIENQEEFKSWVSLTFKENIKDLTNSNKKFANWVRQIKRVFPNFKYLGTPEFQKRGAVHYHLFTNLEVGSDLLPYQIDNKKRLFNAKYWNHGFSSGFSLDDVDDKFCIELYMIKYLYKDVDSRLFSRNKILKSNNLSKPTEKTIMKVETEQAEFDYINDLIKKGYEIDVRQINNGTIIENTYYNPFLLTSFNDKELSINEVVSIIQ